MSITKEENSAFVVNQNQTPTTTDPPKEGEYIQILHKSSVNSINFANSEIKITIVCIS